MRNITIRTDYKRGVKKEKPTEFNCLADVVKVFYTAAVSPLQA